MLIGIRRKASYALSSSAKLASTLSRIYRVSGYSVIKLDSSGLSNNGLGCELKMPVEHDFRRKPFLHGLACLLAFGNVKPGAFSDFSRLPTENYASTRLVLPSSDERSSDTLRKHKSTNFQSESIVFCQVALHLHTVIPVLIFNSKPCANRA